MYALSPTVSFRTCFAEDLEIRGVQKAWREAPRFSFRTCFTEEFQIRGVPKAWRDAPGASFCTCVAKDFDSAEAKNRIWAG